MVLPSLFMTTTSVFAGWVVGVALLAVLVLEAMFAVRLQWKRSRAVAVLLVMLEAGGPFC